MTETSLLPVVKKQYAYKVKANAGIFVTLIAVQLLAILFSLGGVGSSGGNLYIVRHFSGDIIIILTLIWILITGINLGRNAFDLDFTFVSNRLSTHFSSMAFLVTVSAVAGVTATLCGMLLRVIMYFTHANIMAAAYGPFALLGSVLVASLYALLLSSIGYLAGMLIRRTPVFSVVLPVLFIGSLFVPFDQQRPIFMGAIQFFALESSPLYFILKVFLVSALAFGSAILLSRRMEVR